MSFRPSSHEPPVLSAFTLLLLAFLFLGISFLTLSGAWLLHGQFIDSDDVLHLLRAQAWLGGQSWFDPVMTRIAPPEGVALHFSRLAELPLAGLIALAQAFGASTRLSLLIAVGVWPVSLLLVFFVALIWAAKPCTRSGWSRLAVAMSFLVLTVLPQFSPGRVDHHGLAALLVLLALGCFARLVVQSQTWCWAALVAVLLALGLQVALETLPWLLICAAWVGGLLLLRGRDFVRPALTFAAALVVSSCVLLALTVPPASYTTLDALTYSGLYVLLCVLIALVLGIASLVSLKGRAALRWGVGIVSALAAAGLFLAIFPPMSSGPYGAVDPVLASFLFSIITEAQPFWPGPGAVACLLLAGLSTAALRVLFKEQKPLSALWVLQNLLLAAATLLAVFYQRRVFFYEGLFCILPFTAAAPVFLDYILDALRRKSLRSGAVIAVVPLVFVCFFALMHAQDTKLGAVCSVSPLWGALGAADHKHLVINMPNEAGRLLFDTPHTMLAAPYHTNVKGNLDALRFFQSASDDEALSVLQKTGADWVLVCPSEVSLYDRGDGAESLAQRLARGQEPDWLKRLDGIAAGDLMLYEFAADYSAVGERK